MRPGFRRRVRVDPAPGRVSAWVEDDFHHMGVTLHHAGGTIRSVEAEIVRAPWSACPGATAQLVATFGGIPLAAIASRGDKRLNCTHLYDMVVLAGTHALADRPTCYDITVADPVAGERVAAIRRDGVPVLRLVERDGRIAEPAEAAGRTLFELNAWIGALPPAAQEAARLLRWSAIVAHGRTLPMERQSDAGRMPPNCFTFQPQRSASARRLGGIIDFLAGSRLPLDGAGQQGDPGGQR